MYEYSQNAFIRRHPWSCNEIKLVFPSAHIFPVGFICRQILITVIQFKHQNEFRFLVIVMLVFIGLNRKQTANEWSKSDQGEIMME